MNALTKLIKLAAGEEMPDPGLQAMADAADIAKGPAGMPGIKIHPDKTDGKDESKEVMRVAHELDAKTKEIAGLRQQLQEAKMDAQRVQVKAEINNEQTKMRENLRQEQQRMLEGLRREQERMYAQIRQEQKELDKKQSELQIAEARQKGELTAAKAEYEAGHTAAQAQYEAQFTAAEAQNRANMAIEQAQHQAQLDKDVSAHDAQIAQSKADSLMDIAQQTTDMYIKQTEKARADADKYFTTQQQQYSASHPVISPALQSRLDGAMQSVGRVGKNLKDMTSMSKLGRAMQDFEKRASQYLVPPSASDVEEILEAATWANKAGVNPKVWTGTDYALLGLATKYPVWWIAELTQDAKLDPSNPYSLLTPMVRNFLTRNLTKEQRQTLLLQTVAEEEFKPIVKGMDVKKPFYGSISLKDRARNLAIMLDRRNNYYTRSRMEDAQKLEEDNPYKLFYDSISKANAATVTKRMDAMIEDYRAAARAYMDKLKNDIYVNPDGLDDKTRLDKLDELNEYYDIVSRGDPDGKVRRDKPFAAGVYDYGLGEYGTYRSAWNRLANSSMKQRMDAAKSVWANIGDYVDPEYHWYQNANAGLLVRDLYKRRTQGIPGINGGIGRGHRLMAKLPFGLGETPTITVDYNPLNWFRKGEYPDIGKTPEEIAYNRKAQDTANRLFGSYTGAGSHIDAGADTFWDMQSIYLPGVAASLLGKVGAGIKGVGALAQAARGGKFIPAVNGILPHSVREGVGMGINGGLTALDYSWVNHAIDKARWNSEDRSREGLWVNRAGMYMQGDRPYFFQLPIGANTVTTDPGQTSISSKAFKQIGQEPREI